MLTKKELSRQMTGVCSETALTLVGSFADEDVRSATTANCVA